MNIEVGTSSWKFCVAKTTVNWHRRASVSTYSELQVNRCSMLVESYWYSACAAYRVTKGMMPMLERKAYARGPGEMSVKLF